MTEAKAEFDKVLRSKYKACKTLELRARQGARGFIEGAYNEVRDRK